MSAHGFASYQPKDVYQYAIYDAGKCADPRNDDDDDCGAPDTFRTEDNVAMPTSRFSFHTLPNMYAELLGGGNVTVNLDRRTSIGVTGYGSYINWLTEGIDLDFQEWWRTPFGGPFGAVGVNAHHGIDIVDVFAEVTRSFDSQTDGGGGFAGIVRAVTSWKKHEIEVSGRYYDQKFANPYARPISAADLFDGLRARDEAGFRVRTSSRFQRKFSLRTSADFWRAPSEDINEAAFYVRGDVDALKNLRLGLWTAYQDKELFDGGGGQCFAISVEDDENGEPIPCGGERYQVTARARWSPIRNVAATLQYTHEVQDDDDLDVDDSTRFRQDRAVTAIVTANPIPEARIRARVRFLDEDLKDSMSLETSTWTSKIPTSSYGTFTDIEPALNYIAECGAPIVVKADGLAAGKGVIVAQTIEEAEAAVRDMLQDNAFGSAGSRVVIEEFLRGEEASFIAMVDGHSILPLATSQDHKARDDGDTGPNTGGMGAYSPAPVMTPEIIERAMNEVMRPTVDGMAADGTPYVGFLYAGLMIDENGTPKVLEFNCRFGDPETQPVLFRLQSDLVDLIEAALDEKLNSVQADWDPRVSLGVVMAAGGYPHDYRKGDRIDGLPETASATSKIFHAGTAEQNGDVVTSGGRVLCAVALGETTSKAQSAAYELVHQISWADAYYRNDIGYRAVAREQSD